MTVAGNMSGHCNPETPFYDSSGSRYMVRLFQKKIAPQNQSEATGSFMQTMETLSERQVHEMLKQGAATLVTVNRRLAKYAMGRYGQKQVEAGLPVWETPDILPYSAWLERCLEESNVHIDSEGRKDAPLLLRPLQEQLLWEEIIENDASHKMLFRSAAVARMAEQARQLCVEWRIPIDAGPLWAAVDPAVFAAWSREFEDRCRRGNWMDRARLADAVRDRIVKGHTHIAEIVIYSGFDDFSPQAKEVMEALASRGITTCLQAFPSLAGSAVRTVLADEQTELKAAAKWARARMERNPAERIGIISGALSQSRDTVCRIFEEVLHPFSMISVKPVETPAYNISMGRPLSAYPLVRSALTILDMVKDDPETATVGELLLSPYTKGAEREMTLRARADALIRKSKQVRMPFIQIFRIMKTKNADVASGGYICPVWCKSLEVFERICLDMPDIQSPSAWCTTFSAMLDAFGWPGEQPLDSDEYQTHEAWQDALIRFAAVAEVSSGLSFRRAESMVKRLLEETLFQPETEDTGLQIMGVLEAAGCRFDAVWITGFTSDAWPRPPAPNPFIPMPLQRYHNLPRATAARELEFARKITRRLMACAGEVVISRPAVSGDSPLFPSALIDHLPEVLFTADQPVAKDYRFLLSAAGDLEAFTDVSGPSLEQGENIPGGTGVVKSQAACPFSAFVQYRLGARPLDFPVSGIDAADRGILVHKVLERVWQKIGNHRQLTAQKQNELSTVVSESVTEAISAMAKERPRIFTGRFAGIEKQRLEALVMQWLEHDAARSFFEVIATECGLSVHIGNIRLHTFADRIERLENGRQVIIDYKSGDVSVKDWFVDRIAEPQLPLYCLALDDMPAGVFFARIKKGAMKYIGIADDESIVNGIKAVADSKDGNGRFGCVKDIVDFWKAGLEALAEELFHGHAPVSPVSVHKSCRYCHLKPVCRIYELLEMGLVKA